MIARSHLLVSVRSADEAQVALAAGADLIDVKEPAYGSLGKAEDSTIQEAVRRIGGARLVSAAMGEWLEENFRCPDPGLSFIKWGLAGAGKNPRWRPFLEGQLQRSTGPQAVIVAYADWQCAQAPDVDEVVAFACQRPGNVLLIDTHCKDAATLHRQRRPTLLDWLPIAAVMELCQRCREASVRVTLAGSLGMDEIEMLRAARPDWFAVRGAVCSGHQRQATVQAEKIVALANFLQCR